MNFDNSYQKLGDLFSVEVPITPLSNPQWLIHSESAFESLGHSQSLAKEWLPWFNGMERKPGDQRRSQVYAGHQFGVWAGQLGDGRAVSLGEVICSKGVRQEVQLKGSGKTPFSRFGDGKAVVRSSIREFLVSEAMFALNIPTTRALAVLTGDAPVQRETLEKEALCVRLIPSNLRFGTFEWFASQGDKESLKKLLKYSLDTFFQTIEPTTSGFLKEVVLRTARMIAAWQAVGFCHGVMNTDNMSILGVTLDYGPFGFLETTDLNYICNHTDHQGRYSYGNQPAVALWNLHRLAAVLNYMDENLKPEPLLNLFISEFESEYLRRMSQKLGINPIEIEASRDLIQNLLQGMQERQLDFTSTFRKFTDENWQDLPMKEWVKDFEKLKIRRGEGNPIYVLKNYVAERAIRAVEDQRDKALLNLVFRVLQNPYKFEPDLGWWSGPSPEKERCLSVSCSS